MTQELLQRFLRRGEQPRSTALTAAHLRLSRGGVHRQRTFEFNQFSVTIDCESGTAIVEDELNVAPSGEARWSFEEFSAALWR
jgi:hypothetical protein